MTGNMGGGLRLPDALGPGEQQEHGVQNVWDTFDEVELEMTRMGFPPIPMPNFGCPELTADLLTTPNASQYTTAYQQMEGWHNYAINTLARMKALQLQIANEMSKIERLVKDGAKPTPPAKKLTVDQLKDMVENHPRYEELKIEDQEWEQKKIILQSHCTRLEKDLKLLSRQVEIRRQDWEGGGGGKGVPSGRGRG